MHERPGVTKEFWQGLAVAIPLSLIAWGLVAVLLLMFGCAGRRNVCPPTGIQNTPVPEVKHG
jgi:hypothetical protein